jgi:hypothetical protein
VVRIWLPHVGDRGGGLAVPGVGQPVGVFDGAQHAVVVDALVVEAGFDHRTGEDRGDVVVVGRVAVVLVPGDDQEAVVGLCPSQVVVEVVA